MEEGVEGLAFDADLLKQLRLRQLLAHQSFPCSRTCLLTLSVIPSQPLVVQ